MNQIFLEERYWKMIRLIKCGINRLGMPTVRAGQRAGPSKGKSAPMAFRGETGLKILLKIKILKIFYINFTGVWSFATETPFLFIIIFLTFNIRAYSLIT